MNVMKWVQFGLAFGLLRIAILAVIGAMLLAALTPLVAAAALLPVVGPFIGGLGALAAPVVIGTTLLMTLGVYVVIFAIAGFIDPYVRKIVKLNGLNGVWLSYAVASIIASFLLGPLGFMMVLLDWVFVHITAFILKLFKMNSWIPTA